MDITLNNAYAEVNQVLNILGRKYKNKVPRKLLKLFNEQQNIEYKKKLEQTKKVENLQISRTALTIISILNLKYWETDLEKKKELKQQYLENERKYQEAVKIGRENRWLNINKKNLTDEKINIENEIKENTATTSLSEIKKNSLWNKIKKIIKKFFLKGVEK